MSPRARRAESAAAATSEKSAPSTVRDIMTTEVICATAKTSVARIAQLMDTHAISGLPVVDEARRVIGIVTDFDLIIRNTRIEAPRFLPLLEGRIPLETPWHFKDRIRHMVGTDAQDAMTRDVVTISPNEDIEKLADLMVKAGISVLPVVEGGRLAGVVSRADIVRWMTREVRPAESPLPSAMNDQRKNLHPGGVS